MHAKFDFTLEGCAYDEGRNSHNDFPHCSPSNSILEKDLSRERVLINPPYELAEQIGRHFESFRRTNPTSTMAVLVLPKWAKFNELTRHHKIYEDFQSNTPLFTRETLDDSTQHEVVALASWYVQLWLVAADCAFYDPALTTTLDDPSSVHLPLDDTEESIATMQQFSPKAAALLTDLLMEARPLIRTEVTVKTFDGGQLISGFVDCATTLDFVSEDFVRRFALHSRKSQTKTPVRLANDQRVTSSTICDITFELARHEFQRIFYVLLDLRATNMVLGLPWLDDEQASLQFGTSRVFTLMDGTSLETQIEERCPECLLMSSAKIQKLMRKTHRSKGHNAEFYVIDVSPAAERPAEFHTGEELIAEQRENFRSLLYDDFSDMLQPVDSPHISRQWDHPNETTGPMQRQHLNILSLAERTELNRQVKEAMEADLTRPIHNEFGSTILFCA
jgi:hypothetical protein